MKLLHAGNLVKIDFDWTLNGVKWERGTPCVVISTNEETEFHKLSGMQTLKTMMVMLPNGEMRHVYEGDVVPIEG